MKIAIVDDEEFWRTKAEKSILAYNFAYKIEIEQFENGESFLRQKQKYDIVFLDVEMNKIDGFVTASKYKVQFPDTVLIILSSHTELSRKGYIVNAFRYIDKGNMDEEMKEALSSSLLLLNRNRIIEIEEIGIGREAIVLSDILYIETVSRNICLHTLEHDFITNIKISDIENQLHEFGFFRCHKSYIVNLDKIRTFDKTDIYLKDGSIIMVSARKYQELKKRYLDYKFRYANS